MKPGIQDIKGIGVSTAKVLTEHGFTTPASIANASITEIAVVPGFSEVRAAAVKQSASELLSGNKAEGSVILEKANPVEEKSGNPVKLAGKDKKKAKEKSKKKDKKKAKEKSKKKDKKQDKKKAKGKSKKK